MKAGAIFLVQVFFVKGKETLLMGRLARKGRKIFFEYSQEFINTGLELSPFKLPLKSGVIPCDDLVFDGLFGVFNDSLPDGWGRLLLDRKLNSLGIEPAEFSPLDRLCYVGQHGMGALSYEPIIESYFPPQVKNLDEIAKEILLFQENDDDYFVDELLGFNGSSAGARPKVLVQLEQKYWIIKFRAYLDTRDTGAIEYAYHLMAEAAGVDVPQAKLFPSKYCPGYFGVIRFDRVNEQRLHMHTISGLLHADFRQPSLDYETILKAVLWLTKDVRECEKQFRRAVFNVLSHNRDDHAKNFSFLMDINGNWRISPAYDLTFSAGPAGEHCSMVMGEGKSPQLSHLIKLAEIGSIKQQRTLQIIEEVQQAVAKWEYWAKNAGVSTASRQRISTALHKCRI